MSGTIGRRKADGRSVDILYIVAEYHDKHPLYFTLTLTENSCEVIEADMIRKQTRQTAIAVPVDGPAGALERGTCTYAIHVCKFLRKRIHRAQKTLRSSRRR